MQNSPKLILWQRGIIFFTGPLWPLPIFWATQNFEKGGKTLRDEHYRWMQWGAIFYLLLLCAALYIGSKQD